MKPRVVVFYGGDQEHSATSRESGKWICQYIPKSEYDVTPVHVTHDGNWQVPLGSLPKIGNAGRAMEMLSQSTPALDPKDALERLLQRPVDSIITILRGRGGDDGGMNSLAETLRIPVSGSSSQTSNIAYNKHHFAHAISGIAPTPHSEVIKAGASVEEIANKLRTSWKAPFFVKPVRGAGSHGIFHVQSPMEIPAVAQAIHASKTDMLVQEQCNGEEISVTLLQDKNRKIHILPPSMIRPAQSSFFNYHTKLRPESAAFHHEHPNHKNIIDQAQAIAHDVYEELACNGIVTIDMMANNRSIRILDLNTIPTFTHGTPIVHQLRHAGIHPEEFIKLGYKL